MSADAVPAVQPPPVPRGRRFHTGMAVACLLTAVAGFGPTYFFKPLHPSPPLPPLLHVHGMAFTAWLVLMIVQSGLVRAERVDLHRRLGVFGALLAAAMVFLGLWVAVEGARRGASADGMTPLAFMIFPFGQTLMFGGFVAAGVWKRRQPDLHRRLILLGTITLLTPAISRLVDKRSLLAMFLTLGFVAAAMVHDWRSRRRVHPVYLLGALILLLSGPLRALAGNSAAWQSFARALASWGSTSPGG